MTGYSVCKVQWRTREPSKVCGGQGRPPGGMPFAIRFCAHVTNGGDCCATDRDQWDFLIERLSTQKLLWKCMTSFNQCVLIFMLGSIKGRTSYLRFSQLTGSDS